MAFLAALSVAACEYNVRDEYDMDAGVRGSSPRPYQPSPAPDPLPSPGTMLPPSSPPPSSSGEEDAGADVATDPVAVTACEGAATPCEDLDMLMCEQQKGCSLEDYECAGLATPCNALSKIACNPQYGCSWIPK